MTDTSNRYLAGNFAPVREEITADAAARHRHDPRASCVGRLLRIGPNPLPNEDRRQLPLVHRPRHGARRAPARRPRRVVPPPLGPLGPGRATSSAGPRSSGPQHGMGDNTANTNVVDVAGRTFAIVEAGGLPVELTDDLETVGASDFDGTLGGSFTAHPKRDPATGELHAVTYYWEWDHVRYVVVGTDGRVRRIDRDPRPRRPDGARLRDHRARTCWCSTSRSRSTSRWPARAGRSRTRGTPSTRRASACCRATAPARATSAGSRSSRATSSTR